MLSVRVSKIRAKYWATKITTGRNKSITGKQHRRISWKGSLIMGLAQICLGPSLQCPGRGESPERRLGSDKNTSFPSSSKAHLSNLTPCRTLIQLMSHLELILFCWIQVRPFWTVHCVDKLWSSTSPPPLYLASPSLRHVWDVSHSSGLWLHFTGRSLAQNKTHKAKSFLACWGGNCLDRLQKRNTSLASKQLFAAALIFFVKRWREETCWKPVPVRVESHSLHIAHFLSSSTIFCSAKFCYLPCLLEQQKFYCWRTLRGYRSQKRRLALQ